MANDKPPKKGGGGNSHQRIVARTADGTQEKATVAVASPEPQTNVGHYNFGDSVGFIALLFAVVAVAVTPPLIVKVILLALSGVGCFLFAHKSHWTHDWSKVGRNALGIALVGILAFLGIPQFLSQWRTEHQATVAMSSSLPTLESLMMDSMPSMSKMSRQYPLSTKDGKSLTIEGIVYIDLVASSTFTAFHIPSSPYAVSVLLSLATSARVLNDDLTHSMIIKSQEPGEPPQSSASFVHTGKIYVYHDDSLTHRQMADIEDAFSKEHFSVVLRGPDYLASALEGRRKAAATPALQQHTHANWLAPHQTPRYPLFPLHEDEVPTIGLGYRNAGDYPLTVNEAGGLIDFVPKSEFNRAFQKLYKRVEYRVGSGTLVNGTDDYTYGTYLGPKLNAKNVEVLKSGDLLLCAVGVLKWEDVTGKYETTLYRCLGAQADHSFRWMVTPEDNAEHERHGWVMSMIRSVLSPISELIKRFS